MNSDGCDHGSGLSLYAAFQPVKGVGSVLVALQLWPFDGMVGQISLLGTMLRMAAGPAVRPGRHMAHLHGDGGL